MMSAYADECAQREADRLGAAALFKKPFEVCDFLTAVLNLLPSNRDSEEDRAASRSPERYVPSPA